MGKMIGAAEFKTHCLRILDEVRTHGRAGDDHQARAAQWPR